MSCSGAWSAVTVSRVDHPAEIVVEPLSRNWGTLLLVIVVVAELGEPTE